MSGRRVRNMGHVIAALVTASMNWSHTDMALQPIASADIGATTFDRGPRADLFPCKGSLLGHDGVCSIFCALAFRTVNPTLHVDHAQCATQPTPPLSKQ